MRAGGGLRMSKMPYRSKWEDELHRVLRDLNFDGAPHAFET